MYIDAQAFGRRLRDIRHARSLTTQDMADILATTPDRILGLEQGLYQLDTDMLVNLSDYFRITFRLSMGQHTTGRNRNGNDTDLTVGIELK